MIEEPVFKIQLGKFYLQMPNNLENLRYAQKWIGFFVDYLEKQSSEFKEEGDN